MNPLYGLIKIVFSLLQTQNKVHRFLLSVIRRTVKEDFMNLGRFSLVSVTQVSLKMDENR